MYHTHMHTYCIPRSTSSDTSVFAVNCPLKEFTPIILCEFVWDGFRGLPWSASTMSDARFRIISYCQAHVEAQKLHHFPIWISAVINIVYNYKWILLNVTRVTSPHPGTRIDFKYLKRRYLQGYKSRLFFNMHP